MSLVIIAASLLQAGCAATRPYFERKEAQRDAENSRAAEAASDKSPVDEHINLERELSLYSD